MVFRTLRGQRRNCAVPMASAENSQQLRDYLLGQASRPRTCPALEALRMRERSRCLDKSENFLQFIDTISKKVVTLVNNNQILAMIINLDATFLDVLILVQC